VKNVVFLVFKKQSNETTEKFGVLDSFEDFLAGD
jgi:hypothetical protein